MGDDTAPTPIERDSTRIANALGSVVVALLGSLFIGVIVFHSRLSVLESEWSGGQKTFDGYQQALGALTKRIEYIAEEAGRPNSYAELIARLDERERKLARKQQDITVKQDSVLQTLVRMELQITHLEREASAGDRFTAQDAKYLCRAVLTLAEQGADADRVWQMLPDNCKRN